jgi:hypothetical protein
MDTNSFAPYKPLLFKQDTPVPRNWTYPKYHRFRRLRGFALGSKMPLSNLEAARSAIFGNNQTKKFFSSQRKSGTGVASAASGSDETRLPVPDSGSSPFDLLSEDDGTCSKCTPLLGRAKSCVRLLTVEHGVSPISVVRGPIHCGGLRAAVRQAFPASIPLELELSIKTSQKLEADPCDFCADKHGSWLDEWKRRCIQVQDVDPQHLADFKKQLRGNVPRNWNKRVCAYIPNGHATLSNTRGSGGNWNIGEFSEDCRVEVVYSSGKPRIVTLFSEYNNRVLTPLHLSLYKELERKGWLLAGPPTEEAIAGLNGGDYLSVDYQSATDNIKVAYVRAAIEVLIEQAEGLSDDDVRCLRAVASFRLDGEEVHRCQPMGSLMSFPLLCLVNKTVVDMSLSSLLARGEISFKEWTSHRCLINGDDLALRDCRGKLFPKIVWHGTMVGLVTNEEKTMRSRNEVEINSTLFRDGNLVRKTNCSSLYPGTEVNDVLGFSAESTTTLKGFEMVVSRERACHILSRQVRKPPGTTRLTPGHLRIIRKNKKTRHAVMSVPGSRREPPNPFPLESSSVRPTLKPEEERIVWMDEVARVRPGVLLQKRFRPSSVDIVDVIPFRRAMRERPSVERDLYPVCVLRGWERIEKEKILENDKVSIECDSLIEYNWVVAESKIQSLIDTIKRYKRKRSCVPAYPSDDNLELSIYTDPP